MNINKPIIFQEKSLWPPERSSKFMAFHNFPKLLSVLVNCEKYELLALEAGKKNPAEKSLSGKDFRDYQVKRAILAVTLKRAIQI